MDLPDTRAAFNPAATFTDLTIKYFFTAKEKALPTWSLMDFQPFMSFCRKAQRMCLSSSREGANANAAALGELMDIALRVYRTMERLGELGPGNVRFKARMYLHLQHMTTHRVLHASAIAMTVFSDATDSFVARLPGQQMAPRRAPAAVRRAPAASSSTACTPVSKSASTPKAKKPLFGCYLCTATDHFANDTRFHPLLPDGTIPKLTAAQKRAIIDRIEASNLSAALKATEKENVRRYWSQHSL